MEESMTKPGRASPEDFLRLEMRIGTVLSARPNKKARRPAYVLEIDFGEKLGVKTSSARITDHYRPEELAGRQVVAVVNFPPLRVAGVKSEVLVLGAVQEDGSVVLLQPERPVRNGVRIA